jgi:hypothetical protein
MKKTTKGTKGARRTTKNEVQEPRFAPGELAALLAEGEASIAALGTMDGETFFRERRKRLAREVARRRSSSPYRG